MSREEKNKLIKQCIVLGLVLFAVILIAVFSNSNSKEYSYDTRVYPKAVTNDFENNILEEKQNLESNIQINNLEITNIVSETIPEEMYEPNMIKGKSGTIPNIEIQEMDFIDE